MFHYVYKTTNSIDGKYYIGVHSSKSMDDSYLGSGHILKRAIKKHGTEAFTREIIFCAFSKEDAFAVEQELVTLEFTLDPNTYNICIGGKGHKGLSKRSRVVDIYDKDLNFVCSQPSYTVAAQYLGVSYGSMVRGACLNADLGKGSQVKGFYVCHNQSRPCKHDLSHLPIAKEAAVKALTGKKRPEHSKLMSELNEQRKDPTAYNFVHKTGLTFTGTRHELINEYPDHKINASELGMLIRGQYKSHRGWKLTP